MHSPQLTQEDSPIGLLLSKLMEALYPLPMRPMTSFPLTSVQARMQRSQRMQAEWLIAMEGLELSAPLEEERGVKTGSTMPSFSASPSSSQS
jgi:hypothetical protein